MELLIIFGALLFAHFLFDYPLQGDFLAKAKNKFEPIPHMPWYQAMFAHSFLQAAGVYIILGIWWIALLELIAHFWIDYRKCQGEITYNEDQAWHVGCKVIWMVLAIFAA